MVELGFQGFTWEETESDLSLTNGELPVSTLKQSCPRSHILFMFHQHFLSSLMTPYSKCMNYSRHLHCKTHDNQQFAALTLLPGHPGLHGKKKNHWLKKQIKKERKETEKERILFKIVN